MHESMEKRLGSQRPLGISDVRAKKRLSLVGTFLILPAALLGAGLLVHLAWRLAQDGVVVALPVAIGVGGALAAWGFIAAFPNPYGRAP